MRRCPNCNRTYTDESLSFCLHDGSPLVDANVAPPVNPPAATVPLHGSRYTNPPLAAPPYQAAPMVNQMRNSQSWSPMPGPQQPKRSVWPWIIGIVAILGVMGVGVVILIVALASMNSNRNSNSNTRLINRNANQWNANVARAPAFSDDFSTQNWQTGTYAYGTAWYKDDEYHVRANRGGYLVMYAPNKNYQTENATVRVTTRSVEGVSPTAGYGLVVHSQKSNATQAISNYAFLIRTGDTPDFQVLHHLGGKKYTVKEWSRSPYIRSGANTNQLQVVARNSLLTFSVNGHELTTLTAMPDSVRGLIGFYTTDANDVAFDDLEIIR